MWFTRQQAFDIIVERDGKVIAVLELKSLFGNSPLKNSNNRANEALGIAENFWASSEEEAFSAEGRPWLGFLMLAEDSAAPSPAQDALPSQRGKGAIGDPFAFLPGSRHSLVLFRRALARGVFSACCLITTRCPRGGAVIVNEPDPRLSFDTLIESMASHVIDALRTTRDHQPTSASPR